MSAFSKILLSSAGFAMFLGFAAPAHAGVSEDFSDCDGLRKPKRSDDGMRGEATFSAFDFRTLDGPRGTLNACNRALESGKLRPGQTLRRAHIMRARAVAKLQLGDLAGALADLEAARSAGEEYSGEFFYDRSMGVSIDLLKAIVLHAEGRHEEALTLADQASAKRSYAMEVQWFTTMLHALQREVSHDHDTWQQLNRIDPSSRDLAPRLAEETQSLAALAASAGEPSVELNAVASKAVLFDTRSLDDMVTLYLSIWAEPVSRAMTTAYALAADGQFDAAQAWVEATRASLDSLASKERDDEEPATDGIDTAAEKFMRISIFEPMAEMVDARIAISEGRLVDAAAAVEGKKWRSGEATKEFYAAYAAAREKSALDAPELPALLPAVVNKRSRLFRNAARLLMRPESQRKLIDYQESRPAILGALVNAAFSFGISLLGDTKRSQGFRSSTMEDGTTKVEYIGNTTSGPVVQEMTLLRAAEIAQEAGKTRFRITSRKDYQRYRAQTMNGVTQNQTLIGYKTELTIQLLDEGADEEYSLDAIAVIDALGPIYYSS